MELRVLRSIDGFLSDESKCGMERRNDVNLDDERRRLAQAWKGSATGTAQR